METIIVKAKDVCLMQDPGDLSITIKVSEKSFKENPDATFRVPNTTVWRERVLKGRLVEVIVKNKDHTDLVPEEKAPEKPVESEKEEPVKKIRGTKGEK